MTIRLLCSSKYMGLNAKYVSEISDKVEWTLTFTKDKTKQYKQIDQLNLIVVKCYPQTLVYHKSTVHKRARQVIRSIYSQCIRGNRPLENSLSNDNVSTEKQRDLHNIYAHIDPYTYLTNSLALFWIELNFAGSLSSRL